MSSCEPVAATSLALLPDIFRFSDAVETIGRYRFNQLLAAGLITQMVCGLYRKREWLGDEDLVEIALKSPKATIALQSALARHDLIDANPSIIDIAIPRGSWAPIVRPPVQWHHFDAATFDLGREQLDIGSGQNIGIYSAERCLIDAFRLRHREGEDMANDALKQWLRRGGQPSALMGMAQSFPRARSVLQRTLSILL